MIEYLPGAPWNDIDRWGSDEGRRDPQNPFNQWRESIRPAARAIQQRWGECPFHFADLSCEFDDDAGHRLLVLHWCCSFRPDSTYVQHLVKASGAKDVAELKAALIDPENYVHPFTMNFDFHMMNWKPCLMDLS